MHFVFYVRGIYSQVELWKVKMRAMHWKWTIKNTKTGKEETILVQGSLRPSLLGAYEYIIPEPCLPECLACMGIHKDWLGATVTYKLKANLAMMRIMLGAKKIPKKIFKEAEGIQPSIIIENSMRGLSNLQMDGVAIHPIGIRYDVTDLMPYPNGVTYEQEML